jgi:hypothetical protein
MEIDMEIRFFALNEYTPSLSIVCGGEGLWDQMCEAIADHVLGADPYSETAARDLIDLVEMESTDGAEYVEAIYLNGKLVGSVGAPFWYAPSEYIKL